MNLHHGLATTAAAIALAISAAPTVAQAAPPPVQAHYSDVYDVLLPDSFDPAGSFCGGLTNVPLHVEIDGYFSIKDHGPNAPSPYFADRYRSTIPCGTTATATALSRKCSRGRSPCGTVRRV